MMLANSKSYMTEKVSVSFSDVVSGLGRAHLLFLEDLRERPIYPFGIQTHAKLPDDQASASLKQPPIGAEDFEEVVHKRLEVAFLRA